MNAGSFLYFEVVIDSVVAAFVVEFVAFAVVTAIALDVVAAEA